MLFHCSCFTTKYTIVYTSCLRITACCLHVDSRIATARSHSPFDVSSATLGSLLKSLCQEADRCSYVQMLSQKLYDSGSLGDECE